ncbi:M23 family metallopeptidase [Leucobacter albus]|uniref:M23 family metallopeptidase n=1 Tax=Leucobacter albus TaxID=272210 RepID=A0ABW3TIA1_9MICO
MTDALAAASRSGAARISLALVGLAAAVHAAVPTAAPGAAPAAVPAAVPDTLSAAVPAGALAAAPVAALAGAAAPARRGAWLPPLGPPLSVSGPYRPPPSPYAPGHRGIDLPASPGGRALAPVSGVVSFVGPVADRHVLSIRVDARTVVSFEPLEQAESGLAEGDAVERGQAIGVLAEGGHCLAECLHLGVRVDDAYVNPLRYFYDRPVLLPW